VPRKDPAKKSRAPRGTGSVFPDRRRGGYIARKTVDGSRVQRWGATQAEAIRRRDAAVPPDPNTTTVAQWCETWLDTLDLAPLSVDSYTHSVNARIVPQLGALKIRALAPNHVEAAIRHWGTELGSNTVLLVLRHLRACLSAALRAGLVTSNPVTVAKKPRAKKPKINPFTPDELIQIIAGASEAAEDRVLALLAGTGCRRGESIALDVTDWDDAAQAVAITKGDTGRHGIGPPKSPHSVRTIRVPDAAAGAVRAAIGKRTTGPMFLSPRGTRVSSSAVNRRFPALLARLKIPVRNLHQLRHTVATHLITTDQLGDVAAYLGDRVETIVRTYLHPTGADPSLSMDRLLGGGKESSK
jgi:integrase